MNPIVKPVGKITAWPIEAAIWKNGEFYNVTFQRSYKDGTEYKSTNSFGRDDLLLLSKIADQSHSWIVKQEKADHQEAQS
jgi:hypothetical protein